MSTMNRPPKLIAALIALLTFALGACTSEVSAPPSPRRQSDLSQTVVVHASTALDSKLPEKLAALSGVRWTRVSTTAMVNLVRVDGGRGLPAREVNRILPFSIRASEPLPDTSDPISIHLAAGRAVLPPVSAALRGVKPGDTFIIGVGNQRATLEVGAILRDSRTEGVEALVPLSVARGLGVGGIRDVIIGVDASKRAGLIDRASALADPVKVRVGSSGAIRTPEAGRLLSLAEIKQQFGEFTFADAPGRFLEPDADWIERNIVSVRVSVLGDMRCHRAVVGFLESAMRELESQGLGHLVTEQSYCYAPRVQFGDTLNISRHTWGIAVDINPSKNGFGVPPTQDPRLVEIMRKWGFAWGGVWLIPDGMHFEYAGGDSQGAELGGEPGSEFSGGRL